MKKLLFFCFLLVLSCWTAQAQDRVITGKVTSSDDGSPIPGVNVLLKGTSKGTSTNSDGEFQLSVPSNATLIFTSIGFKRLELSPNAQTRLTVVLEPDASALQEVVVTALGIEKKRSELVYASQEVKGEQIVQARGSNFVTALSGKVAGLDIKNNNTMGGSTNVVIRGYKSITGSNQALFVIDGVPVSNANTNTSTQASGGVGTDYGNAAADINPDNIESVNVLKGAAATALYGSRAANGVVMITTKKGKKNHFAVTLNSGVTWGKIDKSTFAKYQKEYGAGYGGQTDFGKNVTFDDGSLPTTSFTSDASFGPKFDPNLKIYQWDALDPFSVYYHKARPWVAAVNDPSTFYETSVNSNQSVSVTTGGERSTFRIGYTRNDEKGVLPNSKLTKDLFNLNISHDILKNLTVATSANYSKVKGVGRYGTGYNGRNPNQAFRQWWQVNTDILEQKEAYFRNRQNVTWNWADNTGTKPIYSDNPYWSRYENYSNDSRDHFFGYATLNYKITSWLDILGRVSYDGTFDFQEERKAVGSASSTTDQIGYTRFNRSYSETNYDLLINFNKNITRDISFKGLIGGNMRRTRLSSIRATTNGGLVVPRLYALSNSVSPINPPTEEFTRVGVDGIFANASFGFKEFIFLDLAARQDKSTTLPTNNNSYFYPSVGTNFVFSNILKTDWLTHGKLRANYAEVGNSAQELSLYDVYDKPTAFGSVPLFSLPNTKNNPMLKPERTKSFEAGIEAEFFKSRLGFDFTWYKTRSLDQIIPVGITAATGYTQRYVNSGEVENKGIEVSAFVLPVRTKDFTWRLSLNFTRNRNKVIYLYGTGENRVKNVLIASLQGGVSLNATEGSPYGVIKGTDFIYTNGQRTVLPSGYYDATATSDKIIGNPMPDWLGGINNAFTYKNVSLSFLVDMRQGGQIFSLDQWYGEGTGLYPVTAGLNAKGIAKRLPVSQGGGVLLPGVKADGSPNDIYAENQDGNGQTAYGYAANGQKGTPRAMYVYDGSYVKLREVALTYSLPSSLMSKLRGIKGVDLSIIGRNLWIIHKNMPYSDPEESLSAGNANSGYQSGAYPNVRTYGFNVKLSF